MDVVFLIYPNHARVGIYDPDIETEGKSFIEFNNKKYLIAEPSDAFRVLGDDVFNAFPEKPIKILQ